MIIKNLKKYFTFEVRLKNDLAVMGRLSPKMFFNMMLVGHGNVPHVGWGRDGQDTDTKGTKSTKKGETLHESWPKMAPAGVSIVSSFGVKPVAFDPQPFL